MAKARMSDADYKAQFEPTAGERAATEAAAKASAARSAPKDTTTKTVVKGVRNPLANAMNVARPANQTSPVEDVTAAVGRAAQGAASIARNIVGRLTDKGTHHTSPSEKNYRRK